MRSRFCELLDLCAVSDYVALVWKQSVATTTLPVKTRRPCFALRNKLGSCLVKKTRSVWSSPQARATTALLCDHGRMYVEAQWLTFGHFVCQRAFTREDHTALLVALVAREGPFALHSLINYFEWAKIAKLAVCAP